MSKGFVYILTNPSMPGLVKIGKTTRDVDQRVREISGATGVPQPFELHECQFSPDCHSLETRMHDFFAEERVHNNREFFKADVDVVTSQLYDENLCLVSEFVDEFAPGHVVSYGPATVCDSEVFMLAARLGVDTYELAGAIPHIHSNEAHPALRRWEEIRMSRRERIQKSQLKVVEQ